MDSLLKHMVDMTGHRDHAMLDISVISAVQELAGAAQTRILAIATVSGQQYLRARASIMKGGEARLEETHDGALGARELFARVAPQRIVREVIHDASPFSFTTAAVKSTRARLRRLRTVLTGQSTSSEISSGLRPRRSWYVKTAAYSSLRVESARCMSAWAWRTCAARSGSWCSSALTSGPLFTSWYV